MFKAIYMHTKPLKHTKNMQVLTNYLKEKNDVSEHLTDVDLWKNFSKTSNLILCMHLRMDVSYLFKNTYPLKSMFFDCFCYFYFSVFCSFSSFYTFYIQNWNCHVDAVIRRVTAGLCPVSGNADAATRDGDAIWS